MIDFEMLFATEGQLITEKGNPPEEEEYPGQAKGLDPEDALSDEYHHLHSHGQFIEQCWKCKEEYLEECHDRDMEWSADDPL
jgi:DICT domain-containing protein